MIITKSFIRDHKGNTVGFSFSESRTVIVLYAKKNKNGLLESTLPNSDEKITQASNTTAGVVQLIHSQLNNNQSETLDGYSNAVVINKYGNECVLYVLTELE